MTAQFVAATRARDLLLLPNFSTGVPKNSWMERFGLTYDGLDPFDPASLPAGLVHEREEQPNIQDRPVFEAEAALIASRTQVIERITPHLAEAADEPAASPMPMPLDDDPADLPSPPRDSLARGLVLHKLLEEVLTGEVPEDAVALQVRAAELALQLDDTPGARTLDAAEAVHTVFRGLALPEIHAVRDRLVPKCTVAASKTTPDAERVTLGVADAVVREADGSLSLVVDWKSDVDLAPQTAAHYRAQVATYMEACGGREGLLVFLTASRAERVAPHKT